jgi:phosphatidylinositol alpha-1,6-mannosyltransferase
LSGWPKNLLLHLRTFSCLPRISESLETVKSLLISEIFPPRTGGSGRWFWEIYRRLPRNAYVIAAGQDGRQEEFDRTHDLRVVRAPLTLAAWGIRDVQGIKGYWRAVRSVLPLVRSEQVSMVHCGRCLPEGVMALALKWWARVPYLCYVHGEDVSTATCSREHAWLVRRVLRGADCLIANSRSTERLLLGDWGLPGDKVRVLHPGVDIQRFEPAAISSAIRARLGWQDRPVILTVGRLQKRKGHDQMMLALPAIRKAIPKVLYAIVGDGEERTHLHELVQAHGLDGSVQFLGEVDDAELIHCYQQCDLFVLPNRQIGKDIEGFGMVLLEAQACGKPVVAGASGGTVETMHVPETGRIVCCDGPEALAELVSELLADRDRLSRMGEAARNWVVGRFDWTALSQQAKRLFNGEATTESGQPTIEMVHS